MVYFNGIIWGFLFRKGAIYMARIGYARVSTVEQNEARQLASFKDYNVDNWRVVI